MGERENRVRSIVIVYFPMLIAVLSLLTSLYNGYLNNKFVGIIQSNLGRAEYMRTCKEAIDAYFQVKFRAGLANENAARERAAGSSAAAPSAAQIEAASAVNKFAALGTYLANLRDDATRARYTQLSTQLDKIVTEARGLPAAEFDKQFESADRLFAEMNDDCVKSARAVPL